MLCLFKGGGDNCYLEFHHIVGKLTPAKIIAIVMDSDMRNDQQWGGVLGINIAGRVYVDMVSDLNGSQFLAPKMMELEKNFLVIDQIHNI